MTQADAAPAARPKLGIRTGSSRKLLERKARELAEPPVGEGLEASFPPVIVERDEPTIAPLANEADGTPLVGEAGGVVTGQDATLEAAAAPTPEPMPAASTWSAEDESAFQTLAAQRKAAGYQRRGRDVSDQTIMLGTISPNPGTVIATIVGLVAARGGSVGRADLVAAMADASYPSAKARPDDKAWCQGYVAGAVRNGFLALEVVAAPVAGAA